MPQRRTARDLTRYQLVGQLLAEIRRLMGLSQEDVAAGVGRPQSFISTIEAGQHRVDIVELIDLANVVGFDPAELITRMRKAAQKQENPNQGKLF